MKNRALLSFVTCVSLVIIGSFGCSEAPPPSGYDGGPEGEDAGAPDSGCPTGWGDCDNNQANLCEKELNTLSDCAGCGVRCELQLDSNKTLTPLASP